MFRKPVLVYVTPKALHIYSPSGKREHVWQFPSSLISYGELLDASEFCKAAYDYLNSLKLQKRRVVLLLANQLVFEKKVDAKEVVLRPDVGKEFYLTVPFDQASILKKQISKHGQAQWFAAQGELVRALLDAGKKINWRIESIVPISVFAISKIGETLLPNQVSVVWHHKSLWKQYSLIDGQSTARARVSKRVEEIDEDEIKSKPVPLLQYLLLMVSILSLGGAIVYALSVYGYIDVGRLFSRGTDVSSQLLSPIASEKPETDAVEPTIPVEELHVQMQSSIDESLELVRRSLVDMGIKDIEEEVLNEEFMVSRVWFNSRVDQPVRAQVVESLNSQLEQVEIMDSMENQGADIVVQIGNVK